MRRPHEFKTQEIKDVLWSLSKVRTRKKLHGYHFQSTSNFLLRLQAAIRHPGVFKRVAEHLVGSDDDFERGNSGRGMEGFSPQGLGNLAWACK